MTDKNPTLQCLGSIITTSVSLPHDLADRRIGTGFMPTTSTLRRFFHMGRWAAMTLPASACEEVGRVSWALKKDYYYTTEMQSWYAKMGVCVYLLEWTTGLTFMQKGYGDITINTSQSCFAKEITL